jgi:alkanesulfonate monooxygenase SsuD/methylene tetrahydromethanopterin reductase-like flavin-dependent oxidoreductase (luciferase family)
MKFGIMNLFPASGEESHHQLLRNTLEEIELADQMGFDSVWLAEHHFSEYGILGNPLTFGVSIAERTSRITIGTAVLVLPFYDPVRLAEDIATLDILSGGRLVIGVGRGYQPREFAGFRVDRENSRERYQETLDVLRLALTQENFSYEGQVFSYKNITTYPRPLQAGGPRILQGTSSPESFAIRGQAGEAIITSPNFTPLGRIKRNFELYRDAAKQAGHDLSGFDFPFMQQVWCGDGHAALEQAAQAALNYYQMVGQVIPGSEEAIAAERAYYEKVRRNIGLLTIEQTLTHGGNFGSTQQVIETIARLREELGITHYIGWFRIPTLDRKAAIKAMERFAADVIPALKDEGSAPGVAGVPAVATG